MLSNLENQPVGLQSSRVELIEAQLRGGSFSPHRHDTYTIAVTTTGVQSFNYRGDRWRSLPGQAVILHPDEVHDGYCIDQNGFPIELPICHLPMSRLWSAGLRCHFSPKAFQPTPILSVRRLG